MAVAEGAAQCAHLNLEVRFLNERLRPDLGDQLLLADHLTGVFHQRRQDVEGAAAELHRPAAFEQQALLCEEPERSE